MSEINLNPEQSLTPPCISRLLPVSELPVTELPVVSLEGDLKSCPYLRRARLRPTSLSTALLQVLVGQREAGKAVCPFLAYGLYTQ